MDLNAVLQRALTTAAELEQQLGRGFIPDRVQDEINAKTDSLVLDLLSVHRSGHAILALDRDQLELLKQALEERQHSTGA